METIAGARGSGDWSRWAALGVVAVGMVVVAWACVTSWGAIVHGHPAYAVALALTVIGAALAAFRLRRQRRPATRWAVARRAVLLVLGAAWIAATAWLRPFDAVDPALAAMRSDARVAVTESATQVVLVPTGASRTVGVVFQPGALVEARAYAAVLRPLAVAGYPVIIVKQPLGIAFLALGALDEARSDHPAIEQWVMAGHSLGGAVASIQAEGAEDGADYPVIGLLLHASYPVTDLSESLTASVMSISGSADGLTTPEDVEASRANLPPNTEFVVIEGASHAQFGAYGPQPGDGTPQISDAEATGRISDASVAFLDRLTR